MGAIFVIAGIWVLCIAYGLTILLPKEKKKRLLSTEGGEWDTAGIFALIIGAPLGTVTQFFENVGKWIKEYL